MTARKIGAFFELVRQDETLRAQIIQAQSQSERLSVVQQAGFDFTAAEFANVLDQLASSLSNAEHFNTGPFTS